MAGFLFSKLIFGPVNSRRLGRSLGINLLPVNAKWCNYNCIYCECGWSAQYNNSDVFPNAAEVTLQLKNVLESEKNDNKKIDAITFAGNGEPTLHPQFFNIVDETIRLRNLYMPEAQVAVLTNASMLHLPEVVDALLLVDKAILKLDTAIQRSYDLINQSFDNIQVEELIKSISEFSGDKYIQTLFFRGHHKGVFVDNTTDVELEQYFDALRKINPKQVMVYSLDRETPGEGFQKIPNEKLLEISSKIKSLGFDVLVTP